MVIFFPSRRLYLFGGFFRPCPARRTDDGHLLLYEKKGVYYIIMYIFFKRFFTTHRRVKNENFLP